MNQLQETELMLDSREVAEMVGKRHDNLVRDIDTYVDYLENSKLRNGDTARIEDFFTFSFYKSGNPPRNYRGYKITKKGCEFIAHKMTGQKGAEFTATYINRFHEMEDKLKPQSIEDLIIMQAQSVKELKDQVQQQGEQIQAVKQTFAEVKDDWRKYVNRVFVSIGRATGDYEGFRKESYILLDRRARCDLEQRLNNRIERMKRNGATKTAIRNTNKLDIIEEEPRLKEIYVKIVQEMEARHL